MGSVLQRRRAGWAAGAAILAAAVGACGASAHRTVGFCAGTQLAGRFAAVPGSAGAGNIVYRLTLRNRSGTTCRLTGVPVVRLLGRGGARLPTHGVPALPGAGTAVLVTLAPGASAHATARFSPDVPGPGEPVSGRRCEQTAFRLRVGARGGGATVVPVVPPTPVCEHGRLAFTSYGR